MPKQISVKTALDMELLWAELEDSPDGIVIHFDNPTAVRRYANRFYAKRAKLLRELQNLRAPGEPLIVTGWEDVELIKVDLEIWIGIPTAKDFGILKVERGRFHENEN